MCPIKGSNSSSEVAAGAGPPTRANFAVAVAVPVVVLDGGLMIAPDRELFSVHRRGAGRHTKGERARLLYVKPKPCSGEATNAALNRSPLASSESRLFAYRFLCQMSTEVSTAGS